LEKFEDIYLENYRVLYRVAQKMVGNHADVADIVQEAFIDLFNSTRNGAPVLHPKSWLYRVTMNKSIDHLRKNNRNLYLEQTQDVQLATKEENNDERELIRNAMVCLKPRERMLVVLYSEGLTYNEMAEATGIRISSIGKMLSRALKKIEKVLKNQQYDLY